MLKEHDLVTLDTDIEEDGVTVSAGRIGTVVAVHEDGKAYDVDFEESGVFTIYPQQITTRSLKS